MTAEFSPVPSLADRDAILRPGVAIEFASTAELREFEDLIAPLVDPNYRAELWAQRSPLKEHIRPRNFNGTINDITLTPMEDSYARLMDANQRGWTFPAGEGRPVDRHSEVGKQQHAQYKGFMIGAAAKSIGRAQSGMLQAEVWYAPVRLDVKRTRAGVTRTGYNTRKSGEIREYTYTRSQATQKIIPRTWEGEALKRFVTKPNKLVGQEFLDSHASTPRISFQVVRLALIESSRG